MIELKHVSKAYGSKQALNDVSLTLPQGEKKHSPSVK